MLGFFVGLLCYKFIYLFIYFSNFSSKFFWAFFFALLESRTNNVFFLLFEGVPIFFFFLKGKQIKKI